MKNILKYIKENIFFILSVLFLIIVLASEFIELDYSVYAPGGLVNISDRISNKQYNSKGSFNMTYVTYRKGTLFNLALAKIIPGQDIIKNEDITVENETIDDSISRSELTMKLSISTAYYIAYTKANKQIDITSSKFYLYYITPEATTDFKVADEVLKCDNNEITKHDDIVECVEKHNEGDEVEFIVNRKGKEKTVKATLKQDKKIGVIISELMSFNKDPEMSFTPDKSEMGSSGGLILTLSLYDALTEEDITKGKTIAGTGTIEMDGSVGEIAGVKYKIKGAAKKHADLFIVPSANYDEAKQVIEDNHYDLKLLKADTFDQVLEDLKNYN